MMSKKLTLVSFDFDRSRSVLLLQNDFGILLSRLLRSILLAIILVAASSAQATSRAARQTYAWSNRDVFV